MIFPYILLHAVFMVNGVSCSLLRDLKVHAFKLEFLPGYNMHLCTVFLGPFASSSKYVHQHSV